MQLIQANKQTMSSREIAALTNKRHDHVLGDIRRILSEAGIDYTRFEGVYVDQQLIQRPEILLPKRECDLVISGYSVKYRLAIIDRWQELEAAKPAALPSYAEALRQLADTIEDNQNLQASIAIQAPKAQAFDLIANADGLIGLQAAGKILQQQPNKFIQWLRAERWIYKRPGGTANLPYSDKSNAGYMTTKAVIVQQPDGSERVREQAVFTPKGIEKIALMLGVRSVGEAV